MDPDEALRQIRHAADAVAKAVEDVKTEEDAGTALGLAMNMASSVWALDEWLSKGGFLPEAWRAPAT